MITKKTAPLQTATGTVKPAARRASTKKPASKTALPTAKQSPTASKVATKKIVLAKPPRSTRVAPPQAETAQVNAADGVTAATAATVAVTLTETSVTLRKPRPVRDSFTMSEAEYALLGELKQACLEADYEVKKSELVRVGIALVARLDLVTLKDLLAALPLVKSGRAKKA